MRRFAALCLTVLLALAFCACGESEKVKNAETLIGNLGEITLESEAAIAQAREAFDALSGEARAKVENSAVLAESETALTALQEARKATEYAAKAAAEKAAAMEKYAGEWVHFEPDFLFRFEKTPDESMAQLIKVTLSPNGTSASENGTYKWTADGDMMMVEGREYRPAEENKIQFMSSGEPEDMKLIRLEAYERLLDDVFTVVELTDENVGDFCEFVYVEAPETDASGAETGKIMHRIMLGSKVYDDGHIYFQSNDVAVEVTIPDFTSGMEWTGQGKLRGIRTEDYSATSLWGPYGPVQQFYIDSIKEDYLEKDDVTPWFEAHSMEDCRFGRAKGTLVFINRAYVAKVSRGGSDGLDRRILTIFGSEWLSGRWFDGLDY